MNLLGATDQAGCRRIGFSSSATVYREAQYLPLDEQYPIAPINPYGRTKAIVEKVLRDGTVAPRRVGDFAALFQPGRRA